MTLSPYEFDEPEVKQEEPKKKKTFSSYTFADSKSYDSVPHANYTRTAEYDYIEEEDDIQATDKFKSFIADNSIKGLVLKWFILFFLMVYIMWVTGQNAFTMSNGMQPSIIPHRVAMNMIEGNAAFAFITGVAAFFLSGIIIFMINKKGYLETGSYNLSKNATHGSAKLADDKTMEGAIAFRELNNPEGIVLGRKTLDETKVQQSICVPANIGRNMNFAVFGSSGSGKSYSFARPNLLTRIARGESFIVTDPSGELYRDTAALAEKNGFCVRVLNLKWPDASNGWNPFDVLQAASPMEVQMLTASLVHTILSNTADDNARGDVFFDQSEENLLKALILYVAVSPHFRGKEHERHMGTVYDLLTKLAAQEGILEEFSPQNLPENDPASAPWKMFQGAGKLKTNFITGLASRLELFQTDIIKEMFSHSEINLSAPGQEKCAYYVMSPVTNNKMRFLLSLFFSCAFEQLITDAEASGGRLKVPVFFILDEFKAIGRINAFSDKVANVRKYGISIAMIFQDLNQLKQAYEKDFSSILSNCDTWLTLGVNDLDTAELLSKRAGVATVVAQSEAHSQMKMTPISPVDPMLKINVSDTKRALMNPDEIMSYFDNMGGDRKALVFARNKYPYPILTYDWHLHKLAKFVDMSAYKREARSFIPPWQRGEYNVIGRDDRTFVTTDKNYSSELTYGGKTKERDSFKEKARITDTRKPELKKDRPKAEEVAKKKGIVFNSDAKSSHLVELGLDLTGKKKI